VDKAADLQYSLACSQAAAAEAAAAISVILFCLYALSNSIQREILGGFAENPPPAPIADRFASFLLCYLPVWNSMVTLMRWPRFIAHGAWVLLQPSMSTFNK
jgi:hypothetical protein